MKTLNKKFLKKNKSAFTLVELIIVITILAILATIAFISFQGYTKDSRDTNRLATINSLEKGLQIHQVKVGKLPLPENAINITYSGTVIGYQGIFGGNNSRLINMSKIPLDPLDDTSFTYNVNSDLNAYQITGFFESKSSLAENNLLQKTYAGNIDYSTRVPRTFGKELGVLLLNTGTDLNRPLQEKYNASSFTGIDVKTFNGTLPSLGNVGNLKVILKDNDEIVGTGKTINIISDLYNYKKVNIPAGTKLIMSGCPSGWGNLGSIVDADGNASFKNGLSEIATNVCQSNNEILPIGSKIAMSYCGKGWKSIGLYSDGDGNVTFGQNLGDEMNLCEKVSGEFYAGLLIPIIGSCGGFGEKKGGFVDADGNVTFGSFSQDDVSVCLLK